ncbi:MAG: Tetratricopeptide repeat [Phormidesmis priestleyi Ana]|uniref:Tetratricopeptide repeat n=1 Tax=Phormidesmis priestleyi Ana TaxID=1666911 RepID=A0A0P7ZR84_9CYAN|nr:MAG: Tetratricopeptide repeat [Phormidesmis priestleyi Ana]
MIKRVLQWVFRQLRQIFIKPFYSAKPKPILYSIPRSKIVAELNHTLYHSHPPRPKPASPTEIPSPFTLPNYHLKPTSISSDSTAPNAQLPPTYEDHPDIVSALADSAYLCERQGRHIEAERLYQQVVTLRQKRFGNDHISVADSLSELAALYRLQKRYREAQPLLEQALDIRQRLLPASHLHTCDTLYQLADTYCCQQLYGKAEPLYQQTLTILRKRLGAQHPRTQTVYSDLMHLLTAAIEAGQFSELMAEIPPLDLDSLSEKYPWAKPAWERPKPEHTKE